MAVFILFQGDAFAINKIPQLPCIDFFVSCNEDCAISIVILNNCKNMLSLK